MASQYVGYSAINPKRPYISKIKLNSICVRRQAPASILIGARLIRKGLSLPNSNRRGKKGGRFPVNFSQSSRPRHLLLSALPFFVSVFQQKATVGPTVPPNQFGRMYQDFLNPRKPLLRQDLIESASSCYSQAVPRLIFAGSRKCVNKNDATRSKCCKKSTPFYRRRWSGH
jgi:hypothetical protein